ncbi:MAG: hypothetical protein HGB12_11140 [Bacteroidetes bacterium]|nr:hypothetical protein [Bacteroidota bacterium]
MKILKIILFIFQWGLIFFSALALIFSFCETYNTPISFNYNGFINFINIFAPFNILFASTFVVLTSKYSIEQMSLMKESNINFVKSNERNQWISFLNPHIDVLGKTDFELRTDLLKKLPLIHDYLFKINYTIKDMQELKEFFVTFFISKIEKYEQNLFWLNIVVYPNDNYSYSFDNFNRIFILMINEEKSYSKIQEDLRELYMIEVKKISKDFIDQIKWSQKATEFGNKCN